MDWDSQWELKGVRSRPHLWHAPLIHALLGHVPAVLHDHFRRAEQLLLADRAVPVLVNECL